MKRLLVSFGLITFLLAAGFINPGFSQEPQMSVFMEIQLKPGMGSEFEKFLKAEVLPALKKGGAREMGVWKVAALGDIGTVALISPVKNFAELDGPGPLVKGAGPEGAQAMWVKMEQFATSARRFVMTGLPDLEIAAPEGYIPKMGLQIKATITPGRNEKYEKNVKDMLGILKKTNVKGFSAGRVGVGGNPNQYCFLVPFDSFSDLDAFGIAFQKAASEIKMPSMTGIVVHTEMAMYVNDLELSIQPAAK